MNIEKITKIVECGYADRYYNFKEFASDAKYRALWDMCMNTLKDYDYLTNIIFCNDIYQMPPVKVFVDINRKNIEKLMTDDKEHIFFDNYRMKTYIKQSLGAFWGMVFRYALDYGYRKTVTVVKEKYYGIQTASRFYKESEDLPNLSREEKE